MRKGVFGVNNFLESDQELCYTSLCSPVLNDSISGQ